LKGTARPQGVETKGFPAKNEKARGKVGLINRGIKGILIRKEHINHYTSDKSMIAGEGVVAFREG